MSDDDDDDDTAESGPWGDNDEESEHSSGDSLTDEHPAPPAASNRSGTSSRSASADEDELGADGVRYKYVPCSRTRQTADSDSDDKTVYIELLMVGDSGVGKTSLIHTFVKRRFLDAARSTIGVEFNQVWCKSRAPHWDRRTCVSLVDCAGQDRYMAVIPQRLRSPYGIFLVFDATRRETFDNLRNWSHKIGEYNDFCCRMLVANKMDVYEQLPPAERWMDSLDWDAECDALLCDEGRFMTSAKSKRNVDSMIVEMVDRAIERQDEIELAQQITDEQERVSGTRYVLQNTVHVKVSHRRTTNTCRC